jgi:hypothetical protein
MWLANGATSTTQQQLRPTRSTPRAQDDDGNTSDGGSAISGSDLSESKSGSGDSPRGGGAVKVELGRDGDECVVVASFVVATDVAAACVATSISVATSGQWAGGSGLALAGVVLGGLLAVPWP